MKISYAFVALSVTSVVSSRTFTVYNGCPFTIWPAMFTGDQANGVPDYTTGWEAAEYTAVSFSVPDTWTAGRIWGRRNCDFSTNPGPNSCATGGCNGGLVCDPNTGTGVPPATLAEFTLSPSGQDNYDVSLVDGYDLPMSVTTNVGCPVASCPVDLGPDCPAPLQGPYDSTGFPLGCKSACDANLSGNPANSPNCCSGQYDTPATCPSSGVQYYSYFKSNCPNAYAYAYDDATSLKTCASSSNADYTITFCPPSIVNIGTNSNATSSGTANNTLSTTQSMSGTAGPMPTTNPAKVSSARRKRKPSIFAMISTMISMSMTCCLR